MSEIQTQQSRGYLTRKEEVFFKDIPVMDIYKKVRLLADLLGISEEQIVIEVHVGDDGLWTPRGKHLYATWGWIEIFSPTKGGYFKVRQGDLLVTCSSEQKKNVGLNLFIKGDSYH